MIIAYPESNMSASIDSIIPHLVEILSSLPNTQFEKNLGWIDWSLPDQLAYSTVSAILRAAKYHPESGESAIRAILRFIAVAAQRIKTATCKSLPSKAGLHSRAGQLLIF